jgi:ketosteroid isomerase-like protein
MDLRARRAYSESLMSASNIEIVRGVHAALAAGDYLKVMSRVAKNVRWAVNAADRNAAPWFRVYNGKADLPAFFEDIRNATFSKVQMRAVIGEGDLVMSWSDVAFSTPKGRTVNMQEVQVWRLADGKIVSVDTLLDTAAIAAAFA